MNDNDTSHQCGPTRQQLWSVLLTIYNYYLCEELGMYGRDKLFVPPREVFEALAWLNDWLDMAIREGWIDGVAKEPY
jgi:hypothetical protein